MRSYVVHDQSAARNVQYDTGNTTIEPRFMHIHDKVKLRNQWGTQRVPEQQIHTATSISKRNCGAFSEMRCEIPDASYCMRNDQHTTRLYISIYSDDKQYNQGKASTKP